MFFSSARLLIDQTVRIIFLFLIIALLHYCLNAKQTEANQIVISDQANTVLAHVQIDSVGSYILGEIINVPIFIKNTTELGEFLLEVDFCRSNLTPVGVERGEALLDTFNGRYAWEYLNFRFRPFMDTLYKCQIMGIYDLPNGPDNPGFPIPPHSEYLSLVILQFLPTYGGPLPGVFNPIVFEWEISDCHENTFQNRLLDTFYVSQDSVQFSPADCPPESLEYPSLPSLEFLEGGVTIYYTYPEVLTGDINLNWISYEWADYMLFWDFLLYGDSLLIAPEQQTVNSDINCDSFPWSIADLLYLQRVLHHESPPIPCDKSQTFSEMELITNSEETIDEFDVVSASAYPGDIASVPIWFSNTSIAIGITFDLFFDSSSLSFDGIDTIRTRIGGWSQIYLVINPSELFLIARSNWWQAPFYLYMEPGEGVLLKLNFKVKESAVQGTFLPVAFHAEPNLGHYNAYTDDTGLIFVQPATVSGWIYTDVIAGDANSDGILDMGDLVYLLNYLYRNGMPSSPESLGDFNHDGEVNVSDVVALINYFYRS